MCFTVRTSPLRQLGEGASRRLLLMLKYNKFRAQRPRFERVSVSNAILQSAMHLIPIQSLYF